ncbi:hypothetical protein [Robbsia sp. KACC 23696]|uniref:hypothetical protein n=1 Tax=Robbsia sp. KACC 23696 TaxID=3149231 RepID=UPI00325B45D3
MPRLHESSDRRKSKKAALVIKCCRMIAMALWIMGAMPAHSAELSIVENNKVLTCESGSCRLIQISGSLASAIKEEYNRISTADLFHDGNNEIVATHNGVNSCSRFFSYNAVKGSFLELNFSDKDICGYKIVGDILISVVKDGVKLRQDIYQRDGNTFRLHFSDNCYGCDQVIRTVYDHDAVVDKYLVDGADDYGKRKPLFSTVTAGKALLYGDHSLSSTTHMYLVNGDKVQLLDFDNDDESMYYIRYVGKSGKTIQDWIKCKDLAACSL